MIKMLLIDVRTMKEIYGYGELQTFAVPRHAEHVVIDGMHDGKLTRRWIVARVEWTFDGEARAKVILTPEVPS